MDTRDIDLDLRQPFTYAQAMSAGVSPSALKGPRFRTLFRGVHQHRSAAAHPLHRAIAAVMLHPPGAFASHASAARVHGLPIPVHADEHVSVFRKQDRRPRPGLRPHVGRPESEIVVRHGIRVSSMMQTFTELGELVGLVDLVAVGDHLVRRQACTPDELREFCRRSRHRGARRALRAASYVRERVDSVMETRLRMLIVLAGLPEPVVDFRVLDEGGRLLYRFDLSYPLLKIVVEYDGRQHRADLDQWDHDTDRADWFEREGWRHVPVFSRGIYRDPAKTLARVEEALRARGADMPRRLSDDWRPHFPGA